MKITEAGTYIVTDTCADGNVIVKKGTTGVVLILKDLDLTSKTGAAVSVNKGAEAKIIIDGNVKLTDAEDPADEESSDADVADAFDGAALKAKDGSNVCLTGDGKLTIDASSCKNGIKVGDEDTPGFVIDGGLTIDITAANDGINAGYDLTIKNADITISAADDAIHADRILTIEDGAKITITKSNEGIEGTVVNIFGGDLTVNASDDAINAANKNGTYSNELTFSVNITGGTLVLTAGADGIDSNGNVNITGGTITIMSANNGGDAGIDYDGSLYIAKEATVNNNSGIAGPDGMPQGQQPSQQNGQPQGQQPGQQNGQPQGQQPDQQNGQPQGQQPDQQNGQPQDQQPDQQNGQQQDQKPDQQNGSQQGKQTGKKNRTVTKKDIKRFSILTRTYTNGKLVKATVTPKSGAKVSITKNGKSYSKRTMTAAGTYKVTTKKRSAVNGRPRVTR